MSGVVKIGKTAHDDPATRASQLYTTGVPVPFDIGRFKTLKQPNDSFVLLRLYSIPIGS
ncbi:MAG: hypothetical protein AAF703_05795 [Cyanobacteria bacterium P01_D01_bin.105]